jgi:hypothetical protein
MENAPGDTPLPRAILEISSEGKSPRGALTAADGERMRFFGWTELAALIEDWHARVRAGGAGGEDHTRGDAGPG